MNTNIRVVSALLAALAAGASRPGRAAAQGDTATRPVARPATPADTMPAIVTARDAVNAGIKLLGVYDTKTGRWLDRVTVRDTLGNETMTSSNGVAALNVLEPLFGYYIFEIRKEGYEPRRFRLRADSVSEVMAGLEPNPLGSATQLPTVVSTAVRKINEDVGVRAGFADRCLSGILSCVTRKDLDLHKNAATAELLEVTDGIHLDCGASARSSERRSARGSPLGSNQVGCTVQMHQMPGADFCVPTYFVDGFEHKALTSSAQSDLDTFLHSDKIMGIEVYLSGAPRPARFQPSSISAENCGSIVVWTR